MRRISESWGLGVFILGLLVILGFYLLAVIVLPAAADSVHRWVLPALALIAGVSVFSLGHFSYPRVQNLKVYLAGYVTGLVVVSYVVLDVIWRPSSDGFLLGLFALSAANAVLFALVPSFLKFDTTRRVTWSIVVVETAIVLLMRFAVRMPPFGYRFAAVSYANGIAIVVTSGVVFFALRMVPDRFHLPGIIAGYAVLLYAGFLATFVILPAGIGASLTFVFLPAYLAVGAIVHGFARMEHRAAYDPLLQVYNREYCAQVLAEQSVVCTRPPFTIVMVDIDHFKSVNDRHGHQAGDRVLFAVAQRIQQLVIPDGVVCRYGGEEMAVFFAQKVGRDVVPIMQEVRKSIEELSITHQRTQIAVTVSIGISYRYRADQDLADVVRAADKALYMCKNHGRNQIRMVRIKEPRLPVKGNS
jgi:diguanylate cyclase (GGDEF)-like protein